MKQGNFREINNYFDKIYIITLKKSKDRHDILKKKLDGLDYEIFWGVDGRQEEIEDLEKNCIYNHQLYNLNRLVNGEKPRKLNMGRVGCALSHVNIYSEIVEKSINRSLILEDDVILVNSHIENFINAIKELPDEWELLYLGHNGSNRRYSAKAKLKFNIYKLLNNIKILRKNAIHYRNMYPRPYSEYLERSGHHWGTHAYAVTNNGAEKILQYQKPIIREADNLLADLCRFELINAFSLKKHVFIQDIDFASTIVLE